MTRAGQRGVTLLESMIAIVLVALGVLGILGVQLRTLADTQTAVRRAQAIRLIEDLSERLKANPSALAPGVLARYEVGWGAVTGSVPNCASGCTAGDMARADIAQWKQTVASTMPLGDAAVFATAGTAGSNTRTQLGVMISWRENERQRDDLSAAENEAFRTSLATDPVLAGAGAATTTFSCPDNRTCHMQYLQPTMRCTPYTVGDPANPPVICP